MPKVQLSNYSVTYSSKDDFDDGFDDDFNEMDDIVDDLDELETFEKIASKKRPKKKFRRDARHRLEDYFERKAMMENRLF